MNRPNNDDGFIIIMIIHDGLGELNLLYTAIFLFLWASMNVDQSSTFIWGNWFEPAIVPKIGIININLFSQNANNIWYITKLLKNICFFSFIFVYYHWSLGIVLVFSYFQFGQIPSEQWCGGHPHRKS